MKFYKISVSKLRFIEGKRKTMREVPDDLKNELMEDPHQKGIFVSKQVRTNFNDEFKTDRHEVYKTRKKIRILASEYLKEENKSRVKTFEF